MSLFYIDTSDQNNLEIRKQHIEEIKELAKQSLLIGENADNDIFPEFLWETQLNEYEGDDYKLRGTCENPNVLKAYTIRRKYGNYWDYIDAMDAYLDYVDYIDSAYGSFEMMKNAADNGMSVIYIPKKPKLTNKKSNKNLIKSGFIPSKIIEDFITNAELLQDAIDEIPKKEVSYDNDYQLPKRIEKLHSKEVESKIKSNRVNSIYASNSTGYLQGMDAIINFLNNPNTDSVEDRSRTSSSFAEEMESLHEFDYIPQDIVDEMFSPRSSYIVNSEYIMNPDKQRQRDILMALAEGGYNSFLDKSITSGMDKEVVRAVTKKYGSYTTDYSNLTPKQIKKLKKKEAKRRKMSKERLIGDRRLQDALLRNRVHLSRDSNLNFRLCDVIPEDD